MFGFDSFHILLVSAGAAMIASYWLPRLISGREPAASALLVLLGLCVFAWVPGIPAAIDPTRSPRIWEVTAELCVIIGLFGTGLRIDRLTGHHSWRATIRLLVFAMPLTILALAIVGWQAAGMTLAGGAAAGRDPVTH